MLSTPLRRRYGFASIREGRYSTTRGVGDDVRPDRASLMDMNQSQLRAQPPSSISTSLFQQVVQQDAAGWQRFVKVYGPAVFYWCRKDGVNEHDAADIGQEVFRAVAHAIGRFERKPGVAFAAWLRTITRNKVANYWRRQQTTPRAIGGSDFQEIVGDLAARHDVSESVPDDATGLAIIAQGTLAFLKDRFTEKSWAAFWETAVNNRSSADVAEDLGMTPMAVRKAKSRVLRCLRDELDGDVEF